MVTKEELEGFTEGEMKVHLRRIRQRSYELTKKGYSSEESKTIMEQEGLLIPISHYPLEQRKGLLEAERKGIREARMIVAKKKYMGALKESARRYFAPRPPSIRVEPVPIFTPIGVVRTPVKKLRKKKKIIRKPIKKKRKVIRKRKPKRRKPRRRGSIFLRGI